MQISCGLLMYVRKPEGFAVLLVHPGGPYWRGKDAGAWSIPKGLVNEGEDFLAAAVREFREETNLELRAPFIPLTSLKQRSGKVVHCWAFEGSPDLSNFKSSQFEMEWPRGSGRMAAFQEVDRAELFELEEARRRILPGQRAFLDELAQLIAGAVEH